MMSSPFPTRDELWSKEAALDKKLEARRARYKCKQYLTPDKIERWRSYSGETLERHHSESEARKKVEERKRAEAKAKLSAVDDEDAVARAEIAAVNAQIAKIEDEERKKAKKPDSDKNNDVDSESSEETSSERKKRLEREERKREYEARLAAQEKLQKQWNDEEAIDKSDTSVLHAVDKKLNDKVAVWQGDITVLEIDAIVNAAKESLLGGGGVDGAIHDAAGDWLYEECRQLNGAKAGEVKVTRGYRLPAKYVFHAVGPVGKRPKELRACYDAALQLALDHKVRTIAFSAISTGVYGYPLHSATRVALDTVRRWLAQHADDVDLVIFCVFPNSALEALCPLYFPVTEPAAPAAAAAAAATGAAAVDVADSSSKKKKKRKSKKGDDNDDGDDASGDDVGETSPRSEK